MHEWSGILSQKNNISRDPMARGSMAFSKGHGKTDMTGKNAIREMAKNAKAYYCCQTF